MKRERWAEVEQLYHAALEHEPAARAAFLDAACAGDAELRREVAGLLAYDDPEASFIKAPALQIAARALAVQPLSESQTKAETNSPEARQLGTYQLLELLGRGGMGEVHLALDTRLRRKVAVKLLPAEFTTQPERVRRFAQEARAASALNHPNIITIYEIGESEATHYIVTEYVEGQTLRQRLAATAHGRLSLAEALEVVVQIAAALSAAHEAGITHRDIKPENVMVRHDGIVKVLDFGLAKLTEPSEPRIDTSVATVAGVSTESGIVMGTPRYMSPEQARGEKVDGRTDLFSLGVLLYEMSTGHAPFAGATTSDVIAAILKDEAPPLTAHAPDAPPELERIVSQALRKNRAERYQTAQDLLSDLKQLQRDLEFASEEKKRSGRTRAAGRTPNKGRRAAIIALAGVVLAATAGWFYFNRAPVPTNKGTILLADFDNKTGEEIFDGTLKQGLAIQLQQSPLLNLFPDERVRQTLRLMGRSADERVTAEVAREICLREGIEALIAGSIAPLGSHYVITLEALNGQSGEALAREQIEAESKEQVLRKLSQATTQLREKLGESLSSIQQFDRVLEDATTSNLEAFKLHSQAVALAVSGRELEAIPFEKRAVELDPNFAYAWSILSVTHFGTGRPGLAAEYATKAYTLRERVSEFEQFRLAHRYHYLVTGDVQKAIEALLLQKRMYPRVSTASSDLALAYYWIGRTDQAIAEARESLRLYPNFFIPRLYLGLALLRLNRFAEAREVLAQAIEQNIVHPNMRSALYQLAYIQSPGGDAAGMQQQLDWARGRPDEYLALDWQTGAAAFAGQWRKAQELARRAIDLTARGEMKEVAAHYATEQALRGAIFGDCRQAKTDATQGLKLERGRVSLPRAALALALCGEAKQARPLVDELTKLYPEDTLINELWLPAIKAAIALQGGNATQAIAQLQTAARYEAAAEFWPQYLRGQAYLQLGRGVEAATEFQKILAHRGQAPLSALYPLAYLGLARAAALSSELAQSQKAREDFLAAWKNADPDLPPLREAKVTYGKK
jgi:eukaryotic-like serine/threonine-protein kinase